MAGEHQPSSSEIGRRLDALARDVHAGFDGINLRLDKYVLGEVHQLHVMNTHRRIDDLDAEVNELRNNSSATLWRILTAVLAGSSLLVSATVGILALVIK